MTCASAVLSNGISAFWSCDRIEREAGVLRTQHALRRKAMLCWNSSYRYHSHRFGLKCTLGGPIRVFGISDIWVGDQRDTVIRWRNSGIQYISYWPFCCAVSLSIQFTSCAVFWRARRASENLNNAEYKFKSYYTTKRLTRDLLSKTPDCFFSWLPDPTRRLRVERKPVQISYSFWALFVLSEVQ